MEKTNIKCPDCDRDDALVSSWEVEGNLFCVRCGITVEHSPNYKGPEESVEETKKRIT